MAGGQLLPAAAPGWADEWTNESLRPEIAASWWRSKVLGVKIELPVGAVVPAEMLDGDERLRQKLEPVLDDLAAKLEGTNSSILLADQRAVIIDRRWTTKAVEAALDRFAVMPGYHFGEEYMGTNAVGTAVEERKLVRVAGPEHYAEILKSFSCLGVPLTHPLTRRLIGVLDLTFPPREEHPLMLPFIVDAGRRIETLLAEWESLGQRAQFDCFLALSRRSRRPVLSVMDDTVLFNRAARDLDPVDQAVLVRAAEELSDATSGRETTVRLSGLDEPVSLVVHKQSDDARFPGVVLMVGAPRRIRSGATRVVPSLPGLVGSSSSWTRLCTEAHTVAAERAPTLIVGESGVGKLAVASALHALGGAGELLVMDAATIVVKGAGDWIGELREKLIQPQSTVVIRHLHLCATNLAPAIAAELEQAPGARVIATADAGRLEATARILVDRFCARLEVPPLSERVDDIPALVTAFLAEHGSTSARFHPTALAALAQARFDDNLRELRSVVLSVAARRRTGDILPADLPPLEGDRVVCGLTSMERVERDAILRALRASGGRKAAAAESLGISRPTLYRKLAAYKIA